MHRLRHLQDADRDQQAPGAARAPSRSSARGSRTDGALYSDLVFAKDELVAICEQDGVPYLRWGTFDDVREALEGADTLPGLSVENAVPDGGPRDDRAAPRPDRRPATAADADAIFELVAACELDADGVAEIGVDDIIGFGRQGFDPTLDSLLVLEGDELVAYAEIYRGRGEGDVRPSHRGRGIGAALLGWIERRARSSRPPRWDRRGATRPRLLASCSSRTATSPHGPRG